MFARGQLTRCVIIRFTLSGPYTLVFPRAWLSRAVPFGVISRSRGQDAHFRSGALQQPSATTLSFDGQDARDTIFSGMQGGDSAQLPSQWRQVVFFEHHHDAHSKMLQRRRPPFVPLLKLMEIVNLLPPPEVLVHSSKELKATQTINLNVCDVRVGKGGEWACDQKMPGSKGI